MMDCSNLRAFVAIANSGSFSRAADTLELTQSAVSKRMAALEQELGTSLFDRMGRQLQLTEAGQTLLPHARRVLAEMEAGRRAMMDREGTIGGVLRIGASHHVGLHRLPPILRTFTTHYPQVELDIQFLESEQACSAVEHGELELAVVTLPEAPDDSLTTQSLWEDPLHVVVGKAHPLGSARTVTAAELIRHQAVLPSTATFTRRLVRDALQPHVPRVRMETNYLETIRMLVAVGLGWSVLPRTVLDDGLVTLDVEGIMLHRRLGLIRHRNRTLGNAALAFLSVAQTQARHDMARDRG